MFGEAYYFNKLIYIKHIVDDKVCESDWVHKLYTINVDSFEVVETDI